MKTFTPLFATLVVATTLTGCQTNSPTTKVPPSTNSSITSSVATNKQQFTSPDGTLSFKYTTGADGYVLDARQETDGYGVVLIRTTDAEAIQNRPDAEGPISMNVIVFPNTDNQSATEWVETSGKTNFTESIEVTPRNVNGIQGIQFNWEGLYNGQTVIIATEKNIYSFTQTTNAANFVLRSDFNNLLRSAILQ